MFKRILVPLDGSERAEQALPVATRLAKTFGCSILLVRVASTLNEFGMYSTGAAVYLQDLAEKDFAEATTYLAKIAHALTLERIETRIIVLSGQAAPHILAVVRSQEIDLIVLCSHGRTGFKRWALGSIAEKIARQSTGAVLLVREQNLMLKEKRDHPLRALVALDGSAFAEVALLPAAQLVAALSAPGEGELHLMQLVNVPTVEEEFGYLLDADFDFRQTALQTAGNYLQFVRVKLLQELSMQTRISITWSVEECKDVADTLIQLAASGKGIGTHQPSDLIALTTHGRSGLQRWMLGSVTERVLHGSMLPLLIVHPQQATQECSAEEDEPPLGVQARDSEEK